MYLTALVCAVQPMHFSKGLPRNQGYPPFALPSSWKAALALIDEKPDLEISTVPVCLVKGSKKSGKSTLARLLVNRLLNRSVLLRGCVWLLTLFIHPDIVVSPSLNVI